MKKSFAIAFLSLLSLLGSLAVTGCSPPPPPVYYAPPPPLPPPPPVIARHAYADGYAAARNDMQRGLPPRVDRHPRFRVPPVPPGGPSHVYRVNFRRGYFAAYGR